MTREELMGMKWGIKGLLCKKKCSLEVCCSFRVSRGVNRELICVEKERVKLIERHSGL